MTIDHRAGGPVLILVLVLSQLLASATKVQAGWDFPEPFTSSQIDSMARAHHDAGALILFKLDQNNFYYDRGQESVRGTMYYFLDVLVLDNTRLAEIGQIFTFDSPMLKLKKVEVEIVPHDGRKTRRLDHDDLNWISYTPRGGGLVILDSTNSHTVVPGLQTGDRLRVKITYDFKGHHGMLIGRLSGDLFPCMMAALEISLPLDHELEWASLGEQQWQDRVDYQETTHDNKQVHRWQLTDIPVVTEYSRGRSDDQTQVTIVPHITATSDGIKPTSFAAGPDWASIAANYRRRIEGTFEVTPELRELAQQLTAQCSSDAERIDVLYGHVQQNTRYLGLYKGLGGIIPEKSSAVMASGFGDCKGLGSFLIGLLRAVNIEAWPVLVRTEQMGPLATSVPNPIQFNHFIVWANDGTEGVWLDATLNGCPAGAIYPADAASPVLLLQPGAEGLHEIPFAAWRPGNLSYEVTGTLSAEKTLTVGVELTADGIAGVYLRALGLSYSQEELADVRERKLRPTSIAMRTTGGTMDPGARRNDDVTWTLDALSSRPLPGSGPLVFMPYILPPLPQNGKKDNPDQIPDWQENWTIQLPTGWTVASDSLRVEVQAVAWVRKVWQDGDKLRLERQIIWNRELDHANDGDDRTETLNAALKKAHQGERGFINITTGS